MGKKTAGIGAVLAIVASLACAAPAVAGTIGPISCGYGGYVSGSTEGNGQITYISQGTGHCGTLGIRVNYTHVGGASWTSWKYSSWGGGYVSQNVGNSALKSQHTTSVGSLNWESFR